MVAALVKIMSILYDAFSTNYFFLNLRVASAGQFADSQNDNGQAALGWLCINTYDYLRNNLTAPITELVMDETYKLSQFGYGLFAITVRYKQCTHPLAFMLISENRKEKHWRSDKLVILLWALRRHYGPYLNLVKLHTDKDAQEMRAVEIVFGSKAISLCWWHWQQSIEKLLRSPPTSTNVQIAPFTSYQEEVLERDVALLQELNIVAREWNSWGVETQNGSPLAKDERRQLVKLLGDAMLYHPFLPLLKDGSSEPFTPPSNSISLWSDQLGIILCHCREKFPDKRHAFVRLYQNWLNYDSFLEWAFASHPTCLPEHRTTMVAETYFRFLKGYGFGLQRRARMDKVVYITTQVTNEKLEQYSCPGFVPPNQTAFNRRYRECMEKAQEKMRNVPRSNPHAVFQSNHYWNFDTWQCTCRSFRMCRFLLCHHLVCVYLIKNNLLDENVSIMYCPRLVDVKRSPTLEGGLLCLPRPPRTTVLSQLQEYAMQQEQEAVPAQFDDDWMPVLMPDDGEEASSIEEMDDQNKQDLEHLDQIFVKGWSEIQQLNDEWMELKAKAEQKQEIISEWSNNLLLMPTLQSNEWLRARYVQNYDGGDDFVAVRKYGSATYDNMRRDSRLHKPAPNRHLVGTPSQRATFVSDGIVFEKVNTLLSNLSSRPRSNTSSVPPGLLTGISIARPSTPPLPANRRAQ